MKRINQFLAVILGSTVLMVSNVPVALAGSSFSITFGSGFNKHRHHGHHQYRHHQPHHQYKHHKPYHHGKSHLGAHGHSKPGSPLNTKRRLTPLKSYHHNLYQYRHKQRYCYPVNRTFRDYYGRLQRITVTECR